MSNEDIPTIILFSNNQGVEDIFTDAPINIIELVDAEENPELVGMGKIILNDHRYTIYAYSSEVMVNKPETKHYSKAVRTELLKSKIKESAGLKKNE